jgi:hypothetical protein
MEAVDGIVYTECTWPETVQKMNRYRDAIVRVLEADDIPVGGPLAMTFLSLAAGCVQLAPDGKHVDLNEFLRMATVMWHAQAGTMPAQPAEVTP